MVRSFKKQLIIIVTVVLVVSVLTAWWLGFFAAKSATNNTDLLPTGFNWVCQPTVNSTNQALLSAATALLKSIYVYSPNMPDYLPTSYTDENSVLTDYVVHAAAPTNVTWASNGQTQLVWKSRPYGTPFGWSGTVSEAGQSQTHNPAEVMTDCSGFITSLFLYANTECTTKFTSWSNGSLIPEAGCFNPQGSMNTPNPLNYYRLFTTGENGWFQSVSLTALQPGDIIAFANTGSKTDSGHIMLVAAVSTGANNQEYRYVVVIDETGTPHSYDTRNAALIQSNGEYGAGIGMGIAKLAVSSDGSLQFFWQMNDSLPVNGSVAIGGAL